MSERMSVDETKQLLDQWVRALLARYPKEVEGVWQLFETWPGPGVLLKLADSCYDIRDGCDYQKDQIEQVITFDPALKVEHLQVWFLRPRSEPGVWCWGPGDPPAWVLDEPDEHDRACYLAGVTTGCLDWYHEREHPEQLYPPNPDDEEVTRVAESGGPEKRLESARQAFNCLTPAQREEFIAWAKGE
jgi:hypothetical protein